MVPSRMVQPRVVYSQLEGSESKCRWVEIQRPRIHTPGILTTSIPLAVGNGPKIVGCGIRAAVINLWARAIVKSCKWTVAGTIRVCTASKLAAGVIDDRKRAIIQCVTIGAAY
eukprot:1111202-Prymnesium_polylepis.1